MTFASRALALRFGVVAQPSTRRRHGKPTPLLGGFGIYSVLAVSLGYAAWAFDTDAYVGALFLALSMIFLVGVIDDWKELKAGPKFLAQFIAAALILAFEPNLPRVFSEFGIPAAIGYSVAWLWVVGITNATNLIDGMDGLCSGIAILTAAAIAVLVPAGGVAAVLAPVMAGAAAGFLVHNYHPAKLFLGDSGSLLVGFTLSALSLHVPFRESAVLSLGVLAMLFGLPILDTFLAIYRRARQGRPIFSGDRSHLHHRLMNLGNSTRESLNALLFLQAYSAFSAVIVSTGSNGWASVALALPVAVLFLRGLGYVEHLVSFQSARLSYLFLADELDKLADRSRVEEFLRDQGSVYDSTREGYSVVIMDCSGYLSQIVAQTPVSLVTFYVSLYGALKARLRQTDLIARPSEMQFAVILPGAYDPEGRHAPVFEFLREELIKLQDSHGVFRTDPRQPEGFKVLVYPRDRARILKIFEPMDRRSGAETAKPIEAGKLAS